MRTHFRSSIFAALALTLALGTAPAATAATVDLSPTPLVIGTTMAIPPNIFFILDDSSSMYFEYVPDSVGQSTRQATASRTPATTGCTTTRRSRTRRR